MENKEKYIINQINNHREAVDTEELWATLAGAIPQKEEKKKRGIIWYWGGFLLFMIVGLTGYMLSNNSFRIEDLKESTKEQGLLQETKTQIAELSIIEKDKNETIESEINSNSEKNIENRNSTKSTNLGKKIKVEGSLISNDSRTTTKKSNQSKKILLNSTDDSLSEQFGERDFLKEEEVLDHVDMTFSDAKLTSHGILGAFRLNNLSNLPPIILSQLHFHRNVLSIEMKDYVEVDLNSEKAMKIARWTTFFNTGFSYVTRQLSTIDTEFLDQLSRRNITEKVVGGWNTTTGLSYQISASFGLSSGISIGQIHEQASYNTSYQIETEEELITTIHTQDGAINSMSGNVIEYTNRQTTESRNNTFRYYSIPAILKYRIIENEKYRLSVNGNMAYSFSQRYNGFISLDQNKPAYELTSDLRNDFTRSGGLSFGFGLEAGRKISKKWDVNIGVGMKYLEGISSNANPLKQEYKLYNLTFGISRKI